MIRLGRLSGRGLRRMLIQIPLLGVLLLSGMALAMESGKAPPEVAAPVGSYDVASVHILGIPVLIVAAPVVSRVKSSRDARQRATVIEGNLTLLYRPHALCSSGEQLSEALLEGLVLGGPTEQRLCSGDPWSVLGHPDALTVVTTTDQGSGMRSAPCWGTWSWLYKRKALPWPMEPCSPTCEQHS